jgi:hypothetical protein
MILTDDYTRIAAMSNEAWALRHLNRRLDDILEMASKIKWSRIHEPSLWTQNKIRGVKAAVTGLVNHLELHLKLTGAPTLDIHPLINGLEKARLIFADMPWNVPREPEKWREWEKDLDQKVDEFIQRIGNIKAQL